MEPWGAPAFTALGERKRPCQLSLTCTCPSGTMPAGLKVWLEAPFSAKVARHTPWSRQLKAFKNQMWKIPHWLCCPRFHPSPQLVLGGRRSPLFFSSILIQAGRHLCSRPLQDITLVYFGQKIGARFIAALVQFLWVVYFWNYSHAYSLAQAAGQNCTVLYVMVFKMCVCV